MTNTFEALDHRSAYLRAILEHSPLAILVHDADRRVRLVSPAFERLFQYSESELLGRDIDDILAPDGQNGELRSISDELIAGGSVHRTARRRRKDGTLVDVEIFGVALFDEGRLTGACGIYRDLTEEVRAQEALHASEERYRLQFERSPAGIFRSTLDGALLDCNDAFARILGYSSRNEVLAQNARSLYLYESDRQALLEEIRMTGGVTGREVCMRRRDGAPVWVLDNVTFLPAEEGLPELLEGSILDISDRRAAEEAVRESEQRYRFLFELNPLPMWIYDVESLRFLDVNEAALAAYGYTRAEFLSMRLPDLWPPENRDGRRHPIAESAAKPRPFVPSRHVRKDGAIRHVEVSVVDLPGGPVRRRMALARDVTEQKLAEEALVESEMNFRNIFDHAPVGIYQVAADGRFLTVNPAFARMLGYSPEELVSGVTAEDLYFERGEREKYVREQLASTRSFDTTERRLKSKNGEPVWIQVTSRIICDEAGRIVRFEGFTFDISEKKRIDDQQARLQEAVLETARQWRETFDAIETPVFVVDAETVVRRLNRAAVELAGQTYVDVLGKKLEELGRGPFWNAASMLVSGARSSRESILCRDDAREKIWEISVSGHSVPVADGHPMSIVVARDITAVVKLQESVHRAESMSKMGALVAGVAHEVRNPLFAISATLDAFDQRFRDRDEHKKYGQALRAQLNRMNALMRDLLDYGRPAVLELREVAPAELVRDAVRSCSDLAARNRISVEADFPQDLPRIRVDRSRVVQIFVNLIENAIQHSPDGGSVSVRAEISTPGGERGVRFCVEDRGPGFQPADLPKLFDPFFTRRQGGTGLGLAIVRKIIDEHGGAITPDNRAGGGASVSVWLPTEPPEQAENGDNLAEKNR